MVLISLYELGRQPFGLASPAAWLRRAGANVRMVDLAKESLPEATIAWADLVALYLPMHTAARLASRVIPEVRRVNPHGLVCCYGLYAPLNEAWLRSLGVTAVFGGEFEADLTRLVMDGSSETADDPVRTLPAGGRPEIPRLDFVAPARRGMLPLSRYASLVLGDGTHKVVGYTEASRGCKHVCRHCPIVPVYGGRFRIIGPEVVIEDVRQQVEAGAQHITFGDPDFFNGIKHARTIVSQLHREWPDLTYDVTIKIEHLVKHAALLALLRETGCLFVTSAAESLDDRVLALLDKRHTRRDFEVAIDLCRKAGLALVPTFVAFTPWTTLESYCDLLTTLATLDLIDNVPSIQLAIRLLIPSSSRLLELSDIRAVIQRFDPIALAYPWRHPDSRVDELESNARRMIDRGTRSGQTRREIFDALCTLTASHTGLTLRRPSGQLGLLDRAAIPYLNEPWYC